MSDAENTMKVDDRHCSACGAPLPPNAPMGLCVKCLLHIGMAKENVREAVAPQEVTATVPLGLGEEPRQRIGPYKLLQRLGEGGMGTVWMAEQSEPILRMVALKIIKPGMDSRQILARFEAERQALALMDHPNIAKVLDAGSTPEGHPYFVMELVKGIPLTKFCDEQRLSIRDRLDLFVPVCQAIQHAHQKGIIHRDIKPSNVLVALYDGKPVPKVIDFGIAKATGLRLTERTLFTEFGALIGTPEYMSPEQAEMNQLDIDTRSDIYSLGVLLYELLTGTTPLTREILGQAAFDEVLRRIREEEPPRPSTRLHQSTDRLSSISAQRKLEPKQLMNAVRGDLDWVVMKALEKERNRRYETANALAHDIERHLSDEPISARPPSNLYRFCKTVRRNKVLFAATGAISASLVAGFLVSVWQYNEKNKAYSRVTAAESNQRGLRLRAEEQQKRAEDSARRAKQTLAASLFRQAVRLIAEERRTEALPFLIASIKADSNSNAAAATTRLATLLAHHPWSLPQLELAHDSAVISARFSPDGKAIITASDDNVVRIWNAANGDLEVKSANFDKPLASAEFSPDGTRVITISNDSFVRDAVRLWDSKTLEPITDNFQRLNPDRGPKFNAGGRLLALSITNRLFLVNTKNGQLILRDVAHEGPISARQTSNNGERLVAHNGNIAQLWDIGTETAIAPALHHDQRVRWAEFSEDDKTLLIVTTNAVCLWDSASCLRLTPILAHESSVSAAKFSPDAKRILTASADKVLRVWDVEEGRLLWQSSQHDGWIGTALFSPDSKRILTRTTWGATLRGGSMRVWETSGELWTEAFKRGSGVLWAYFTHDGMRILAGSDDSTVQSWDSKNGVTMSQELKTNRRSSLADISCIDHRIMTPTSNGALVWEDMKRRALPISLKYTNLFAARFSPNGNRIILQSYDNKVHVLDASSGEGVIESDQEFLLPPEISGDGQRLLTVGGKTVAIFDIKSGKVIRVLTHDEPVTSAKLTYGERAVLTTSGNNARLWDIETGNPLSPPMIHDTSLLQGVTSPNGRRIVTLCGKRLNTGEVAPAKDSPNCVLWDVGSATVIEGALNREEAVLKIQFASNGKRILTIGTNTASLWDGEKGNLVARLSNHENPTRSTELSPDGTRVLTRASDGVVLWDTSSGHPLTDALPHQWFSAAQFSPDARRFFTGPKKTAVQVWDAQTGHPVTAILEHSERVQFAQFSPDGKTLGILSAPYMNSKESAFVHLWDTETGHLMADPLRLEGGAHGAHLLQLSGLPLVFSPDSTRIMTVVGTARIWDVRTGQPLTDEFQQERPIRWAAFSRDGTRVLFLTSRGSRAERGGTALVWDFSPSSSCPDWVLQLAEAISGEKVNEQGALEPTSLTRVGTIRLIREQLSRDPNGSDWVTWGRWLLADPAARTISPFSKVIASNPAGE